MNVTRATVPESTQTDRRFVKAYTVYLFVLAVLALMMVFSHQMLLEIMVANGDNVVIRAVFRYLQAIEAVVFLSALAVAMLRTRGSDLAAPTTAALSIFLVMWFPLGTAAFIWWVGWVRRSEREKGDPQER